MFISLNPSYFKTIPKIKQIQKMTVPQELKEKWNELNSAGDIQTIADRAGKSYETIRLALRDGECNDHVFKTIASFYKEKEELIKTFH